jgi:hypothetical protein
MSRRLNVLVVVAAIALIGAAVAFVALTPDDDTAPMAGPTATPSPDTTCTAPPIGPPVPPERSMTVFLRPDATSAERDGVESALRTMPEVVAFTFVNHQQAYQRFAAIFCNAKEIVAQTRPEALP